MHSSLTHALALMRSYLGSTTPGRPKRTARAAAAAQVFGALAEVRRAPAEAKLWEFQKAAEAVLGPCIVSIYTFLGDDVVRRMLWCGVPERRRPHGPGVSRTLILATLLSARPLSLARLEHAGMLGDILLACRLTAGDESRPDGILCVDAGDMRLLEPWGERAMESLALELSLALFEIRRHEAKSAAAGDDEAAEGGPRDEHDGPTRLAALLHRA